jgi:lauroyl/myristoyl acyltransferase
MAASRLSGRLNAVRRRARGTLAHGSRWTDPQDQMLRQMLGELDEMGVRYRPLLAVHGFEVLEQAIARGRGVLMVGIHGGLGVVAARLLDDRRIPATFVSGVPRVPVMGTGRFATVLMIATHFMVRVRTSWRRGGIVGAMIDQRDAGERGSIRVATRSGEIGMSTALISLALGCGASIVFVHGGVDASGQLNAWFEAPASPMNRSAEDITREFVAFLRERSPSFAGGVDTSSAT